MNLTDAIQQLFTDLQDIAQLIAPIAAVIGFLGLGLMYMGSSWPIIGDWKRDNPKAANQVVIGLLFVVFASGVCVCISSGSVSGLLTRNCNPRQFPHPHFATLTCSRCGKHSRAR